MVKSSKKREKEEGEEGSKRGGRIRREGESSPGLFCRNFRMSAIDF